jgi:hypothetical protein
MGGLAGHNTPNGPWKPPSISLALSWPAARHHPPGPATPDVGHAVTITVRKDDTLHRHDAVHGHDSVLSPDRGRTPPGDRSAWPASASARGQRQKRMLRPGDPVGQRLILISAGQSCG